MLRETGKNKKGEVTSMKWRKTGCLFMAAVMSAGLLAGCGGNG